MAVSWTGKSFANIATILPRFVSRGVWDVDTTYQPNDMVFHEGDVWIAKNDVTAIPPVKNASYSPWVEMMTSGPNKGKLEPNDELAWTNRE